jgi:hypothetical protein
MSAEIVVRRKAPAVEIDAAIAPSVLMRDTCAIVGPRIIREHSSVIDGKTYIHVSGATLLAGIFGYHVREVRVRRIEIGDVGYVFRKKFDCGWYTGEVVEILPCSESSSTLIPPF